MLGRVAVSLLAVLIGLAPAQAEGRKRALLVGVKEYDHAGFPELKYTENDAEGLAAVLSEAGYEVVLLTTTRGKKDDRLRPTAANVRAGLRRLSQNANGGDLLLVALSGHGLRWPGADLKTEKGETFFCPSDADPRDDQTPNDLKKTMIPFGEISAALDQSGAGARLLLVDASRHEVGGQRRNPDFAAVPGPKKGAAALLSCSGDERSFETAKRGGGRGVFFHHVIEYSRATPGTGRARSPGTHWPTTSSRR